MTEDLTERLAGLGRAMAAPLPSPEELAAGTAEDKALAERIHKARPGIPQHHAYAVLETLRTMQRVDAAKAEPAAGKADVRDRIGAKLLAMAQAHHEASDLDVDFDEAAARVSGSWIVDGVMEALVPELDELAHYRNAITWETSCLSCASLLDACRSAEECAEQAEADLAIAEQHIERGNGHTDRAWAEVRSLLSVLRPVLAVLPAECRYHGAELDPRAGSTREACCDTGRTALRRRDAQRVVDYLDAEHTTQGQQR